MRTTASTSSASPSNPLRVSARDARRLALQAQLLAGLRPRADRRGILATVERIGYLQLDPTNVVARNPHLVLWSRIGAHDPALLADLLERKRALFETVSYIARTADLPIHGATMRVYRRSTDPGGDASLRLQDDNAGGGTRAARVARWLRANPSLRAAVLARLRREGPLPLSAFEGRPAWSWTAGSWSDEGNVTLLLAVLQRRGEVAVAGRRRGQKLYDLARRVYPTHSPLAGLALERAATLRVLRATGLATTKQIRRTFGFARHTTARALAALERDGAIVRVSVEGQSGAYYTTSDIPRRLHAVRDRWEPRTTLLSPFDNLISDRERTEALFGYRYRIEIYTPVHLRTLGFWAMPVLHGDRIVGSVDPRFERERGELVVDRAILVAGAPADAERATRRAVAELAAFVGAERVSWRRRFRRT